MSAEPSSDDISNTGSTPLQDRTNIRFETELAEKEEEIARLTGLVKGMTKKRGRGRRRAHDTALTDDEEQPTPAKKPKKSKHVDVTAVDIDYAHYGRIVGRFLGPFEDIAQTIEYGTTADCAMSGDEGETDERLAEAYLILWQKFPGFREFLLKLTNKPIVRRAVERQINSGIEAVRGEDTSTLKPRIHLYLNKDPTTPLDPALPSLKDKIHRGRAHPVFARLLTPIHWDANDITYNEISEGVKTVTGAHIPRFIFPIDQVFPINATADDPAWLDVLDNACKGEICLRSAKAIYMGPDSALERDGYHKGRPGKASIIGMKTFTRRVIAGVITQIHFALSAKQEWHKTDGDFDYEEFFWTIYGLFDDEEWAKEIITLWNKVVLGTVKPSTPAAPESAGPSHIDRLKAMRAAKKLAAAASVAPTGTGPTGSSAAAAAVVAGSAA
ncbi:hypothetical protein DFH08DRAFT_958744 [Mycena albidolilacea]|uniref:Uncharacterized protein n=1 Tax=Mycena albidolilacea TaxID=1033008 RepID=A0AAD7EUW4_9AGAR|nr:hypothetical protein DFH08DRAFT_958744 [Mycena albidolilacea]